ncbi:MAG: (4Fe-4S)-binding protein [Longimicrobiales bacterium]
MPGRKQSYEGPGFAVSFDPQVCTHSGACVRGLHAVFDVSRKRWIDVKAAPADQIEAQVGRCPSGALQFVRRSGE